MILIIDNYDSFTYNLYQGIIGFEENIEVFRNDKITVNDIKKKAPKGIILSPGPGKPEDAGICIELIRELSPTTPLLGVCLGHQAIAAAFGGKVIKAHELMHGKSSLVFHNRGELYAKMSLPFLAGRYHSLMVERDSLPAVLKIEAETSDEMIMGMKHRAYPTYGVQFHPESVLSESGIQLLENFVSLCVKEKNHVKVLS